MDTLADIDDRRVVKALSHPLRVRILAELESRTASPSELATALGAPLGTVAYHVRTLARLELIELVSRTPRRGAFEHFYRARALPQGSGEAWGRTPAVAKGALVAHALRQIAGTVADAAAGGGFDQREARLSRLSVTVDAQGWRELAGALDDLLARVATIERDSAARLDEDAAAPLQAGLVAIQFERPAAAPRAA